MVLFFLLKRDSLFQVRRPFWWITSSIYAEIDGKVCHFCSPPHTVVPLSSLFAIFLLIVSNPPFRKLE